MSVFLDHATIIKVFLLATASFVVTIAWTPLLSHYLYKYKLGKKIRVDSKTPIFSQLHKHKSGTPTMGGLLIWVTTAFLAVVLSLVTHWTGWRVFHWLNFLTRGQTLLPLGVLVLAALIGLIDDFLNIRRIGPKGGGLSIRHRLLMYSIVAVIGAWWFYYKLGWDLLHVPFLGDFNIGIWYIPIFIFVIVATAFSTNEIDGLDGLAGGTLLAAFTAFGAIAFAQGRVELAAFCGVIAGALLAFLWFNIPPARFMMGDTGSMSLGVTLGVVAMLTNTVFFLPIIGLLLVMESASVIIQLFARRFLKRKVFLSAPFHHHLEAIGWPEQKIVMRFWVIAAVTAVIGVVLFLVESTYK